MIEKIERMPAHVLISLADCAEGRGLRDCRPARITTLRSLHEMRAAYTVEHAQRQIAIMDYLIVLSFFDCIAAASTISPFCFAWEKRGS